MGNWGNGAFQDDEAQDRTADVVEASDPEAVLREKLLAFLELTKGGYDASEHAEEWPPVRGIVALAEVVRFSEPNAEPLTGTRAPEPYMEWRASSGFRPSAEVRELACRAIDVIAASTWLRADNPAIFSETISPIRERLAALRRS